MSDRVALMAALLAAAGVSASAQAPAPRAGAATMGELLQQCQGKEGWGDPAPPVRIYGNTYYVGTCGITTVLIASPKGHVLIDGAVAEAAPHIAANIERLGFRTRDIKLLLATHEHHDHVGGLAELQRRSGALLRASAAATSVIATGEIPPTDPQYGLIQDFAPVRTGKPLRDGEIVRVGPIRLTAHMTPGHAPGGVSWSWRSCEVDKCLNIVLADSVGAASAKTYRTSDHPERVRALRASMAKIESLDCDVLLTGHPSASNLFDRFAGKAPLIDSNACRDYAQRGRVALENRLKEEQQR